MQGDNKGSWQWTGKVEVDVRTSVIGNITLLNDTLLLELLMGELVWTKNLLLLLLSLRALTL